MTDSSRQLLLVEDNPGDATIVSHLLKTQMQFPCELTHVTRLSDAVSMMERQNFSTVLIDLGLPDSDGIDSLRGLLKHSGKTPVVVLTGYGDETLAVRAVGEGAHEFLSKDDLDVNRLSRAILFAEERTKRSADATQIKSNVLSLDMINQLVVLSDGLRIALPPLEFKVLYYLLLSGGRAVTRADLLKHIWPEESERPSPRCIDALISSLKKKSRHFESHVESVYGVGYRWNEAKPVIN